ncbi:GAF domain-containing protein [Sandaracinus amylolyticus]|uniref:GAF domain-containing protein n=1 Tax=Sandaracinus amylolyticus TaxID=927083 RepID=UPI001F35757B|nr:GAF domain-containing protein [Sandaracinus amylolyticus]UJR78819.1 GAF domain-containing protein [Sandaracinus amylolyticus]
MSEDERERRTSEHPADLTREREAFVRQFLRKGVEVTESLLEENREVREQLSRVRDENARLRAQVASDDAIRDLLRKIEQLEAERKALLAKSDELDERTKQSEVRTFEIEQELHDLANLYIASSHLHATLSVRGVVKHLSELLQQLMGGERYAIFLMERGGERAWPLLSENLGNLGSIVVGEGPIGIAMMTGVPRIRDDEPLPPGTLEEPLAIVPMMVRGVCVGVIVVVSVLAQKERWAAVDHALFDFLGSHGGTALIAANQYASQSDPRTALDGIERHLSAPHVGQSSAPPAGE